MVAKLSETTYRVRMERSSRQVTTYYINMHNIWEAPLAVCPVASVELEEVYEIDTPAWKGASSLAEIHINPDLEEDQNA